MDELLELFELTPWKDELIGAYSHGMRQKLIISSALVHRPEVIVVDEPMVGSTPRARALLKDLFREFVDRGGTDPDEHAHAGGGRGDVRPDRDHPGRQDRRPRGTMDELRQQTAAGDASLEELFLKLTGGDVRARHWDVDVFDR